jgi:molybdenum cofactor cytidylyltransferase
MLSHVIRVLGDAGWPEPIVVLGANAGDVAAANHSALSRAKVVENLRWSAGPGSSLKAGVLAVPADVCGALVLLADQPLISVSHLLRLIAARDLAAATVTKDGVRSPPAYFPSRDFRALLALDDNKGARELLYRKETTLVCCDSAAIDIDFAAQLAEHS